MRTWGSLLWLVLGGCNYILGLSTYDIPDAPTPPLPSHWATAGAGAHSTCGIRLDHTLWCWGRNDAGELGLGDMVIEQDTPAQVGSAAWDSVAGNEDHFCGIDADHSLWCWGRNDHGQLGIGSTDDAKVPMNVLEDGPWDSVAVGYEHACAIKTDHSMWCWGDNGQGELGDGNGGGAAMQAAPVEVFGAQGWKSLTVGAYVTYGIADDSSVWGWGQAAYNALPGALGNLVVPAQLAGVMPSRAISAYAYAACAIRDADGKLVCWGDDNFGQIGDDNSGQASDPTVIGTATWKSVAAGASHTCGVQSDDSLWCWGRDQTDELGVEVPSFTFATNPVNVTDGGPGWSAVFAGNDHTCALDGTAQLQCWGRGGEGQLGDGGGSKLAPVKLAVTADHLALGKDVTCVIDGSDVLSCWGFGDTYALGDGGADDHDAPEAHSGSWAAVAQGDRGCGLTTGQDLLCWGTNEFGQTGTNDAGTNHATPAMVMGAMWTMVAVGRDHGCAIGPTKEVACWGWNNYGCVGEDPLATTELDFPVIVPGTGNTSEVAVGKIHSCAIVGGAAMCWGDSDYNQLGNGGGGDSFVPAAVQGLPGTASQLVVGGFHACVQSGGPTDRWCWGDNTYGQLGDATTNGHKTAVQLTDPYIEMAAGIDHTCGIGPGGRLWCWGANDWGQLGTGDFTEHHTRQQVGSDSDWTAVFAGDTHTCALKLDHTVWCWGSNRYGEIGDGTAWTVQRMIVP